MPRLSLRLFVVLALALAVALALAASPYASPSPDGLARVAADHGFRDRARTATLQRHAPAPGYAFPGIADPRLATGVAGFAGTLVVFAVGFGLARTMRSRVVAR